VAVPDIVIRMMLQCIILLQVVCVVAYHQRIILGPRYNEHRLSRKNVDFRILDNYLSSTSSDSISDENQKSNFIISTLSDILNFINRTKLWGQYTLALELKPVITKSMSSFIGFLVGDVISQVFTSTYKFNLMRCFRMGSLGALIHGPLGHLFYSNLENRFPGAKPATVGTKILLDQLLWTPLFTMLVITYLGIALGASPYQIYLQSKILYPQIVISSFLLWPVSHFINFKFIPMKQRLLFINIVQVIFNAVVSSLFHTKFRVK
jgi:protein Mpv17